MGRRDAEVATDIGEDGADRAAADLGRDFCWRGQTDDAWFGRAGAGVHVRGGARLAAGRGAHGGRRGLPRGRALVQPGFERGGAEQAAGDARDDFPDVDGAEVPRDVGEVGGGGALLQRDGELPAVVDQRPDEAEEAPGAGGCVRAGGWPILVGIGAVGWDGGGGRGGHERNRSIGGGAVTRRLFPIIPFAKRHYVLQCLRRDRSGGDYA